MPQLFHTWRAKTCCGQGLAVILFTSPEVPDLYTNTWSPLLLAEIQILLICNAQILPGPII